MVLGHCRSGELGLATILLHKCQIHVRRFISVAGVIPSLWHFLTDAKNYFW